MEDIEQKVKLNYEVGVGVDILLTVMAAGSVREECSSPQMPT